MKDNTTILLVEDDDNDVFLMRNAFERIGFNPLLLVLADGEKAIQYLNGSGTYANRDHFPWPCMMLLDLKMPRVGGFEVLAWLKKQKELPGLPVSVMSSSNLEIDIHKAMELGAYSYFVKSADPSYYVHVARRIREHCSPNWNTQLETFCSETLGF